MGLHGIFFIAPLILLILIFVPTLTEESTTDKSYDPSKKFRGEKDISSPGYVMFLTKKFDIEFNETLKKYSVNSKLFENLTDAIKFAKTLDVEEDNPTRKKFAVKEKKNNLDNDGHDEYKFFTFFVVGVFILFVSAYMFINSSKSTLEESNDISVLEFSPKVISDVEVARDRHAQSVESTDGISPNDSHHVDVNFNDEDKSPLSQIELVDSLDAIGKRWDVIHSNAAGNEIILKENLAPLYPEVNNLIRQPSRQISSWYCTIRSVYRSDFYCDFKSYTLSVTVKPSEEKKLRNLTKGVLVSFSGVLNSEKFEEDRIVSEWSWQKPKIRIKEGVFNQHEIITK